MLELTRLHSPICTDQSSLQSLSETLEAFTSPISAIQSPFGFNRRLSVIGAPPPRKNSSFETVPSPVAPVRKQVIRPTILHGSAFIVVFAVFYLWLRIGASGFAQMIPYLGVFAERTAKFVCDTVDTFQGGANSVSDVFVNLAPPTTQPPKEALEARTNLKIHVPLFLHLAGCIPSFFLAIAMQFITPGTRTHRLIGRAFMILMTIGVCATWGMKQLHNPDAARGPLCRMSPPFAPEMFCGFSVFHVGTALTMSHIVLCLLALRRRDIQAHKRWVFWVCVAVLVGGPLYPRKRIQDMWKHGEFPAWQLGDEPL